MFCGLVSAACARLGVECVELSGKACEHAWPEGEEVELAFAAHVDEAGGLQFLDVMGECGGGDGEGRPGLRATQRTAEIGRASCRERV